MIPLIAVPDIVLSVFTHLRINGGMIQQIVQFRLKLFIIVKIESGIAHGAVVLQHFTLPVYQNRSSHHHAFQHHDRQTLKLRSQHQRGGVFHHRILLIFGYEAKRMNVRALRDLHGSLAGQDQLQASLMPLLIAFKKPKEGLTAFGRINPAGITEIRSADSETLFGGGQFPGRVSHSGADRDARPAGGDRKALFNKAFFGRGVVDIRIRLFEYAVILPLIDRPFVMCRGDQNLSSTGFPNTPCSRIIEIGHEEHGVIVRAVPVQIRHQVGAVRSLLAKPYGFCQIGMLLFRNL